MYLDVPVFGYFKPVTLDIQFILFINEIFTLLLTIKLVNNPVNHPRAKHIDIQYHKVRELILDAVLKLHYIETSKMVADVLTKPLTLIKYEYFITMLGLEEKSKETAQMGAKLALPPPPPAA